MPKTLKLDLFKIYTLSEIGDKAVADVTDAFKDLLATLEDVCPEGRELAIVRTKLQEAFLFAVESACADPENVE